MTADRSGKGRSSKAGNVKGTSKRTPPPKSALGRVGHRLSRGLRRLTGSDPERPLSTRARLIVAAAAVVVLAVAALVVIRVYAPEEERTASTEVVRVGPTSGENVEAYADRAGSALENAGSGSIIALVSLTAYQRPADLVGLVSSYKVLKVYARVPADNIQTRVDSYPVITAAVDIPAGMTRLSLARAQEANQEKADAAKIADPRQRKLATDNALISQGEAAAYRDGCACLYGVVVSAPADRLQELAQRTGIRVVEPAERVKDVSRGVFVPLQPEQKDVVEPPSDPDLAPSSSPAVTPGRSSSVASKPS